MKKILLIMFHYHYVSLNKIKDEISDIVDLKLYSSKLLTEGKQDIDELNKDIEDSDLLILNRSSSQGIWGEIEETINNSSKEKIYVGEEMTSYINDKEQLENEKVQLKNAEVEVQKEFPQEQELQEKQKRLDELNIKLNLNEKDKEILGNEIDDEKSQDSKNDRER